MVYAFFATAEFVVIVHVAAAVQVCSCSAEYST